MDWSTVSYIRVSSVDQATDRQLEGVPVDKTFTDHASGKDVVRLQLTAMLGFRPRRRHRDRPLDGPPGPQRR